MQLEQLIDDTSLGLGGPQLGHRFSRRVEWAGQQLFDATVDEGGLTVICVATSASLNRVFWKSAIGRPKACRSRT
jgi:hypothetical protein